MKTNTKFLLPTIIFVLLGSVFPSTFSYAEEGAYSNVVNRLHGYVPVVLHEGGFYPVVGVEKKKPIIDVEGRLISVKKDAKVFFWAEDSDVLPTVKTGRNVVTVDTGVGHGLVGANFANTSLGGTTDSVVGSESLGYEAPIKNDDTTSLWEDITLTNGRLANAYGVFIFYSDKGLAELHWRNFKDTAEGEKLSVKVPYLSSRTLKKHKNPRYLLLAYQDEEELVPSDNPQRGDLLNWLEALSMAQLSGSYARATQQEKADPIPVFSPNFKLSESDFESLKGMEVPVTLQVNKMGIVTEAFVDANISASIANKISNKARLWKFLPAIRDGKLADEEVVIPLQF
jgi:hypothetical protein